MDHASNTPPRPRGQHDLRSCTRSGRDRGADDGGQDGGCPKPRPPIATTGRLAGLAARSVKLTGSVNPRRQRTRYYFQYGAGTRLTRRTADRRLAPGTATVVVSATISLAPNRKYSYRLVASNAAGTTRGNVRTFRSPRAPAALTFVARSSRVSYEGTAVFTGNATSAGVGNVALVLERQHFPYTGAFEAIATQTSGSDGAYTFSVSPLLLSARFRVVARTAPPVTSAAQTVRTKVRVGIKATRRSGRRIRFTGDITPGIGEGRVSLQRRIGGRFVTIKRVGVRHPSPGVSSYRVTVEARRSATTYRVRVTPADSSGYVRGTSRRQRMAGR